MRINDGNLLIPILNNSNQLKSLQFINPYGNKWFLKNGEIKGNYFHIGELTTAPVIMICEGYSTGATLYAVTQLPQVIAFNASNLVATAKNIKGRLPNATIIIAADNDSKTPNNIGLTKGKEAAREVGGEIILPKFLPNDSGTDFNDFVNRYGAAKLLTMLQARGGVS